MRSYLDFVQEPNEENAVILQYADYVEKIHRNRKACTEALEHSINFSALVSKIRDEFMSYYFIEGDSGLYLMVMLNDQGPWLRLDYMRRDVHEFEDNPPIRHAFQQFWDDLGEIILESKYGKDTKEYEAGMWNQIKNKWDKLSDQFKTKLHQNQEDWFPSLNVPVCSLCRERIEKEKNNKKE